MSNLYRTLNFAWPYRLRYGFSVCFALLVALFWGANLSVIYPMLTIFFRDQDLHDWIDQKAHEHRQALAQRSGDSPARTSELDPDLRHSRWKQQGYDRAQELIHRWTPKGGARPLVFVLTLLMAGVALKGIFSYLNETLAAQVTELTMRNLKNQLYRHVLKQDLLAFNQTGSSELMSRFTTDAQTLAFHLDLLLGTVIREPLKAVACVGLACWLNWRLTLVLLALGPLAYLAVSTIGRYTKRATRRWLESNSSIYRILQESFQGIRIVKAFTMERYECRRFLHETKSYYRRSLRIVRLKALTSPVTELVGIGAMSVVLLIGTSLVIGDSEYERTHLFGIKMAPSPMEPEALFLLYALLAGVSDPARKLSSVYTWLQGAAAAADRIFDVMDRMPEIVDRADAAELPRHHSSLELRGLEFGYPGSLPVLKGVSLKVRFGETIAIVGPNGCGKTTLLSLIPRLLDPQRGSVLVDGIDIREIRLRSLRRQIAVVAQETVLFNDTIANNIAYGNRTATRTEIEAAAKRACAHKFIEQLPNGYDTQVGERAEKLSGGQRQRIALARAILFDPAILLLDEATSALDPESDTLIQRALQDFVRNRTTILVTHRLGILALADRIVVMNQGRIESVGTHDDLMRRSELYAGLHRIHGAPARSA